MPDVQSKLSEAVCLDNIEGVQFALRDGADINELNSVGETPLMVAVDNCVSPQVLKLLLSRGAHVNAKTAGGMTPLHIAVDRAIDLFIHERVEHLKLDHIQILLEAGADPSLPDDSGQTAINWAEAYGPISEPVLTLLRKWDRH